MSHGNGRPLSERRIVGISNSGISNSGISISGISRQPMAEDKPIKLLVITMLYEPDCVGIAPIASDMCEALAERGHEVTVYTTYPYYPEWKLKSKVNPWRIQQEKMGNVNVKRYGLFVPSNPSRIFPRLIHELSFPVSLMRSVLDRQLFDVVMVYCPLLGSVVFAAIRKLLHREPLWVNIQDIPAEAALASGINRSKLFHRLASLVQKTILNRGEIWSSISPEMVRQLETIKSARTKIHHCPNWLTGSLRERVKQLPPKVGKPPQHVPQLLYSGNIGKKQGLLDFCQAIGDHDFDFRFRIRGNGGEARAVEQWVKDRADARFDFGELLPESRFVQAVGEADWFVIPEKSGSGSSFLPSKLIPSVSVGTPVIAVCDKTGPLGREVNENELGLVVEWPELARLTPRLGEFAENPERFGNLQRSCLRRAKIYSRDHAIDRLEDLLRDCKRG